MREVAGIIWSFPEHYPCIVLSAMGKASNKCPMKCYLNVPTQRCGPHPSILSCPGLTSQSHLLCRLICS